MKRFFTFYVLFVLFCLLGNSALAQRKRAVMKLVLSETIDFTGYGATGQPNGRLSFSNGHPQITASGTTTTFDRLTLENTSHWGFWGSSAYAVSYLQMNAAEDVTTQSNATLSGLQVGDVVTIWGEIGNTTYGDFNLYGDVELLNTTTTVFNGNTIPDSKEYRIRSVDNLRINCLGRYSGIRKITIQTLVRETNHYDYDPGFEDYDMYDEFSENDPKKCYSNESENGLPYTSYSLSDEETGIEYDGQKAKYIVLSNSKISANYRIAIDGSAGTWRFNYGLRAPDNGKWANFSICNLKEGDRVVFSYTGTAPVFSSAAGGADAPTGPYNGSKAFFDQLNDGQFDEGEDIYITPGATPETDWSRLEGNFYKEDHDCERGDYTLYYTRYVITEDGHLDLAIAPDTRIVHIKIYSDHQASMVDEYDANWYTAKFDITGELQANEHIMPGGLEVHVGSSDASQHAHVVSSAHGPVSIVNAVDGFKLPGMSRGDNGELQFVFDLANNIPETGTFYKFMPLEDGKMKLTFQAANMNYYTYGLNGDETYVGDLGSYGDNTWLLEWDRPNEQTVNVNCPYYLVKIDKNGNKTVTTYNNIGNGAERTTPEINVLEGETYYLYGGWNGDVSQLSYTSSGQGNNNIEYFPYGAGNGGAQKACGVARLLEVDFNPNKKIYPLAKWVPNGTTAVNTNNTVPNPDTFEAENYLADLWGYNNQTSLTIKKMTGNIQSCRPYLQAVPGDRNHYRLMIDGITFDESKDKGGTILIKIGDATVKSSPVFALTIAYSGDPQFDGNSGSGTRGHIWDYSSNTLQGLDYHPTITSQRPGQPIVYSYNAANPVTYGQYFADYFAADISNYSSKDEVLENLPKSGSGLLYNEIEGGNSDWMFNYNLQNAGKVYDPVFSNKYDLEGDNADLIWNTEGTVLKTSANASVMFNEFKGEDIHQSTKDPDRYVGILKGGEFRIPWLMPNDRVVIYMGTGKGAFNDQAVFNIRGAYDAVYNPINPNDDYIIGGSKWNYSSTTIEATEEGQEPQTIVNDDRNYRGCYHFFAQGHGDGPADMVFTMTGGTMCKIYSIQIYRGDRIITNEIIGAGEDDKFLLVSTEVDPNDHAAATKGDASNWTLKYFGKDQKLADGTNEVNNDIVAQSGNITKELTTDTDEESETYNTFTYPHDYGEIGTIRVRGKDMEKNMKYVADYGEHNVTIAYQETMKYPYTWDFRDATGYLNVAADTYEPTMPGWFENEDSWNASYEKSSGDLSLWEEAEDGFDLRLNSQEEPTAMDNIFETAKNAGGNQIWAKGVVVPETQGLWFYTENNDSEDAGILNVSDDGMQIVNGENSCPYLVVPNVPANTAVYLRMTTTAESPVVKYMFGQQETMSSISTSTESTTEKLYQVDGTDDYIVAFLNPNENKSNLTLSLNGFQLKRLAVSKDFKSLDSNGWATESREHVVDPDLTWYMTGELIETIFVKSVIYGTSGRNGGDVELGRVTYPGEEGSQLLCALEDGDEGACILHNKAGNPVSILNSGFHLFVPDMHDYLNTEEDFTGNNDGGKKALITEDYGILKAQVNAGTIPATENGATNYILSNKIYVNDQGETATESVEAFYRVKSTGAKSKGHNGYLPMETDKVTNQSANVFDLVFDIDKDADGINEVNGIEDATMNGVYTIDGQKLEGMPTNSGLYIVNGKKVIIK